MKTVDRLAGKPTRQLQFEVPRTVRDHGPNLRITPAQMNPSPGTFRILGGGLRDRCSHQRQPLDDGRGRAGHDQNLRTSGPRPGLEGWLDAERRDCDLFLLHRN